MAPLPGTTATTGLWHGMCFQNGSTRERVSVDRRRPNWTYRSGCVLVVPAPSRRQEPERWERTYQSSCRRRCGRSDCTSGQSGGDLSQIIAANRLDHSADLYEPAMPGWSGGLHRGITWRNGSPGATGQLRRRTSPVAPHWPAQASSGVWPRTAPSRRECTCLRQTTSGHRGGSNRRTTGSARGASCGS